MPARVPPVAAHPDRGSAMIVTLMVMAVVTALSTTVAGVTVNNLRTAWRAQQAGAAVSAADAGVAQALTHLRSNGFDDLPRETSPLTRTVGGQQDQSYRVWIEPLAPHPNNPARYRIHATGEAAGGAVRSVTTDVAFTPVDMIKGIYAKSINGGGDAEVHRQSIFTSGCVWKRSKIVFEGIDAAYGIPAAAHSSQIITDANGSGQFCSANNKAIHWGSVPCPGTAAYQYDQDSLGGSLLTTGCESTQVTYPAYQPRDTDGDGTDDVEGSFIRNDEALLKTFGLTDPALSPEQVEQLRSIAQAQDNYWTSSTGWTSPDDEDAVMFFDLTGAPGNQRLVDLNDITGFSRAPNLSKTDPQCVSKSLLIIVEGGDVKLNSNQELFASVFLISGAPYGQVIKANGTSDFIGTLYADSIDLTGTVDMYLDECFLENPSPGLFTMDVSSYRELDR